MQSVGLPLVEHSIYDDKPILNKLWWLVENEQCLITCILFSPVRLLGMLN